MAVSKYLLVFTLASLVLGTSGASANERRIALQNYNGWDLPFAKDIKISPKDAEANFPTSKYLLGLNPAAFFSIIFVDTSLYQPANPVTIDYSWYGQNNFTIKGEWVDLWYNFTLADTIDGQEQTVNVTLTTFVSYQASPESGLDGFLAISLSQYNFNTNFLMQLSFAFYGIKLVNY